MVTKFTGWVPMLAALYLLTFVDGSDIVFNTSSSAIQPPITKSLTLTCSLQDSPASSNAVIGRRDLTHIGRRDLTHIGRRDLTHTDVDVEYVTSMVVMRDGLDIASVTEHVAAQAIGNVSNVQVKGHISSNAKERGYLELSWQYPLKSEAGEYRCEVTGVNKVGHSFVFSTTLEVTSHEISIVDLAASMKALELKTNAQENETGLLKQENVKLAASVNALELKTNAQENEIGLLKQENVKLTSQVSSLQTEVNISRHVETGVVKCGDSSGWTLEGHFRFNKTRVVFNENYPRAPKVHLSISKLDRPNVDLNTEYYSELLSVDQAGFTMQCRTWYTTKWRIEDMWVTWISIAA